VLDHFSRAVIATAVFDKEATATDIVALLDRAVATAGRAPRHIVSDRGAQFRSDYRDWCTTNAVKPRFGPIGKHGSIAVLERMIKTLKDECLRKIFVPCTLASMQAGLDAFVLWYNNARPHSALGGATPAEWLEGRIPARDNTRLEPRSHFPLARGDLATRLTRRTYRPLEAVVSCVEGRAHLPVLVELREAA
jgi:transposase InsO family protein